MLDVMPDDVVSPVLQRSSGSARVALERGASGSTRLTDLAQRGCAKAMLPRIHGPVPEVVFLNTAGGITGGDTLEFGLDIGPSVQAVGATQTAERTYRAADGMGRVLVELSVGQNARLDWLPQETIVFDGSATRRTTHVELAETATFLWAETLIFGRAAMGEVLTALTFRDDRRVRRAGKTVMWEPSAFDQTHLGHPACLSGARAMTTVAFFDKDAETALGKLRALDPEGARLEISAWDGKLILRGLAADAQPLKKALAAALDILRGGAHLPRVWQL